MMLATSSTACVLALVGSTLLAGCELLAPFPELASTSSSGGPDGGGPDGTDSRGFSEPVRLSLATSAPIHALAVANVAGDTSFDLVITTENELIFQQGSGDGTFGSPPQSLSVSGPLVATAVAEVTGDSRRDLIVASAQQLFILPTQQDGFAEPISLTLAGTTLISSIVAGQLVGDSRTDLVIGANDGAWLFRADGDASFAQSHQTQYLDVVTVAVADVAPAQGLEEIVVEPRRISVSGVSHHDEFELASAISDMVTADLDGDGYRELIVGSETAIEVVFPTSDRRTEAVLEDRRYGLASGDFDGDGDADVVTTTGGDVIVFWNDQGKLSPSVVASGVAVGATAITAAKIDGDNRSDIVLGIANDVAVLLTAL
ncbi:MAG: FG-GAP-like repeat-containing protein [Kofleriaceae bacterium]